MPFATYRNRAAAISFSTPRTPGFGPERGTLPATFNAGALVPFRPVSYPNYTSLTWFHGVDRRKLREKAARWQSRLTGRAVLKQLTDAHRKAAGGEHARQLEVRRNAVQGKGCLGLERGGDEGFPLQVWLSAAR